MSAWTRGHGDVLRKSLLIVATVGLIYGCLPLLDARNPHLADMTCPECHLAGDAVTKENAHQLLASQEQLCRSCHENALAVSHPSGFAPRQPISDEYPLDWKGTVTCSTCHLVHGNGPHLMRGKKRGRELCLSCHDMAFFDGMKDNGLSIQADVHLKQSTELAMEMLDSYTAHCMECHGDTVRSGGAETQYNDFIIAHGYGTMPHPIGFNYDSKAGEGRYRSSTELLPELKLPEGKLSCVTCHQAYDVAHGKLVISNEGSALCFQCHDL
ncbi:cytochrome c3 family protein [Pseudomonadota bacterium]